MWSVDCISSSGKNLGPIKLPWDTEWNPAAKCQELKNDIKEFADDGESGMVRCINDLREKLCEPFLCC